MAIEADLPDGFLHIMAGHMGKLLQVLVGLFQLLSFFIQLQLIPFLFTDIPEKGNECGLAILYSRRDGQ
jgi:hypothetical protein